MAQTAATFTLNGQTYYRGTDGKFRDASGNLVSKDLNTQLVALQTQYPQGNVQGQGSGGSTSSTGNSQPPPAVPITGAGIPGLPGPTPAPKPIVEQGYTGPDSRFGSYNLNPYIVGAGYAPPQGSATSFPGGVPTPSPAPVPSPSPTPSPTPAPVPAPGGSIPPPGGAQGGGAGGYGGNAGGAQQAGYERGGNGGFGGAGGNGGFASTLAAPGGPPAMPSPSGYGYIDLSPWGAGALSAASMAAPGYAGLGLGALQAGMRGYNLMNTNMIRGSQGIPDTDIGQAIGAILGFNNYGDLGGNATVANPDQLNTRLQQVPAYNIANDFFAGFGAPAETANGSTYQSGPGGLLGLIGSWLGLNDTARSLAPSEVNHLVKQTTDPDISALWGGGNAAGNASGGNSARGLGVGGSALTGQSAAQVNRYGGATAQEAGNPAPTGYAVYTGSMKEAPAGTITKNGVNYSPMGGGGGNSGFAQGNGPSALGPGTGFNPGGGTTAPGSLGTGGLNNGFGGGGYAEGGYVGRPPQVTTTPDGKKREVYWPEEDWTATYGDPTDTPGPPTKNPGIGRRVNFRAGGVIGGVPDNVMDNHMIRANEGEFVVRNASAAVAPTLLSIINADPRIAAALESMVRAQQGPMGGMMSGPNVPRQFPMPMDKPRQPTQMAIEGGWPIQPIKGHGIGVGRLLPARPARAATRQPTESDILNMQELARIRARHQMAVGGVPVWGG